MAIRAANRMELSRGELRLRRPTWILLWVSVALCAVLHQADDYTAALVCYVCLLAGYASRLHLLSHYEYILRYELEDWATLGFPGMRAANREAAALKKWAAALKKRRGRKAAKDRATVAASLSTEKAAAMMKEEQEARALSANPRRRLRRGRNAAKDRATVAASLLTEKAAATKKEEQEAAEAKAHSARRRARIICKWRYDARRARQDLAASLHTEKAQPSPALEDRLLWRGGGTSDAQSLEDVIAQNRILQRAATRLGARVVVVPGDGNCMYHALGFAAGLTMLDVKTRTITELRSNPNDYSAFFLGAFNYTEYVNALAEDCAYGDGLALQAAAVTLNARVWLLRHGEPDFLRAVAHAPQPTLQIVMTFRGADSGHYDAIRAPPELLLALQSYELPTYNIRGVLPPSPPQDMTSANARTAGKASSGVASNGRRPTCAKPAAKPKKVGKRGAVTAGADHRYTESFAAMKEGIPPGPILAGNQVEERTPSDHVPDVGLSRPPISDGGPKKTTKSEWACKKCDASFVTRVELRNHAQTCNSRIVTGKEQACPYCKVTFKTKRIKESHIKLCETKKAQTTCKGCGQQFENFIAKKNHERGCISSSQRSQLASQKYHCKWCGDESAKEWNVAKHEATCLLKDVSTPDELSGDTMSSLRARMCIYKAKLWLANLPSKILKTTKDNVYLKELVAVTHWLRTEIIPDIQLRYEQGAQSASPDAIETSNERADRLFFRWADVFVRSTGISEAEIADMKKAHISAVERLSLCKWCGTKIVHLSNLRRHEDQCHLKYLVEPHFYSECPLAGIDAQVQVLAGKLTFVDVLEARPELCCFAGTTTRPSPSENTVLEDGQDAFSQKVRLMSAVATKTWISKQLQIFKKNPTYYEERVEQFFFSIHTASADPTHCRWCMMVIKASSHVKTCVLRGCTFDESPEFDGNHERHTIAVSLARLKILNEKGSFGDVVFAYPDLKKFNEFNRGLSLKGLTDKEKKTDLPAANKKKRELIAEHGNDVVAKHEAMSVTITNRWLTKQANDMANNVHAAALRKESFLLAAGSGEQSHSVDPRKHKFACSLADFDESGLVDSGYVTNDDPTHVCTCCKALLWKSEVIIHTTHGKCCHGNMKIGALPRARYINAEHKRLAEHPLTLLHGRRINGNLQMCMSKHAPISKNERVDGFTVVHSKGKGIKKMINTSKDALNHNSMWVEGGAENPDEAALVPELDAIYGEWRSLIEQHSELAKTLKKALDLQKELEATEGDEQKPQVLICLDELRGREKTGVEFENEVAKTEVRAVYTLSAEKEPQCHSYWPLNGEEQKIDDLHHLLEPLMFPLLFPDPKEETGWRYPVTKDESKLSVGDNTYLGVSALEYGSFHLYDREGEENPLLRYEHLSELYFITLAFRSFQQRIGFIERRQVNEHQGMSNAAPGVQSENQRTTNFATENQLRENAAIPETQKNIILPAGTWERGNRAKQQLLNDSLSINARLGCPDYFITMTANPKWPEVVKNIGVGKRPATRNEVIHRVFNIKKTELVQMLYEKAYLGDALAIVCIVEYQRRGLPHMHCLLWVHEKNKPRTAEVLDQTVCAELPDPETQPLLYDLVSRYMMHMKCDKIKRARCRHTVGNITKCRMGYPRSLSNFSSVDGNQAYSQPKRPDNGRFCAINPDKRIKWEGKGHRIEDHWDYKNNQYVVPYNPKLLCAMQAHINVEPVGSPNVIQYLTKYLFKSEDRATVSVSKTSPEDNNKKNGKKKVEAFHEPREYMNGVYLGSLEAIGYLLQTDMVKIKPAITRLDVNLEGQNRVYFHGAKQTATKSKVTTLTGFFEANAKASARPVPDPAYAGFNTLLYTQVPEFFTWEKDRKTHTTQWKMRACYKWNAEEGAFEFTKGAKYTHRIKGIGRLYYTSPKDHELQCFRVLLMTRPGAVSFQDVRTIDGVPYPTYRDACCAAGLFEDGDLFKKSFEDALSMTVGSHCLRFSFCNLISNFEVPKDVILEYWTKHKDRLCRPYKNAGHVNRDENQMGVVSEIDVYKALLDMQRLVREMCAHDLDYFGITMPRPPHGFAHSDASWVIQDELRHDPTEQKKKYLTIAQSLNEGQQKVVHQVQTSFLNNQGGLFVLQGAAGTGKTYTYDALLSWFRSNMTPTCTLDVALIMMPEGERKAAYLGGALGATLDGLGDLQYHGTNIALAVASSGIAATLLSGGRTAHNRFHIPLDIDPSDTQKTCTLTLDQEYLILHASLIIWDEVYMTKKFVIEMVDRTCQKVRKNNRPFGGIVTVLGGDVKQILPVAPNPAATMDASLPRSYLWQQAKKLTLLQIMRIDPDEVDFKRFVSKIGDGSANKRVDVADIQLPERYYSTGKRSVKGKDVHDYITTDHLIDHCFPQLEAYPPPDIADTIATPLPNALVMGVKNKTQREINLKCLNKMTGREYTLIGQDKCTDRMQSTNEPMYSEDVMNRINDTGIPLQTLKVKIGCPLMLLKNLDPSRGLCNGARMILREVSAPTGPVLSLRCTLVSNGAEVIIQKTNNQPDPKKVGLSFRRIQFPVALAFSATVNKAQGQTLAKAALDLTTGQCFAHGQMYVAFSRVARMDNIKVAPCITSHGTSHYEFQNPVFRELLREVEDSFDDPHFVTEPYTKDERAFLMEKYEVPSHAEHSAKMHELGGLGPVTAEQAALNEPRANTCGYNPFDYDLDDYGVNCSDDLATDVTKPISEKKKMKLSFATDGPGPAKKAKKTTESTSNSVVRNFPAETKKTKLPIVPRILLAPLAPPSASGAPPAKRRQPNKVEQKNNDKKPQKRGPARSGVVLPLRGLPNREFVWCFANAMLQALCACLRGRAPQELLPPNGNASTQSVATTRLLQSVFDELVSNERSPITAHKRNALVENLRVGGDAVAREILTAPMRQQDTAQFLELLWRSACLPSFFINENTLNTCLTCSDAAYGYAEPDVALRTADPVVNETSIQELVLESYSEERKLTSADGLRDCAACGVRRPGTSVRLIQRPLPQTLAVMVRRWIAGAGLGEGGAWGAVRNQTKVKLDASIDLEPALRVRVFAGQPILPLHNAPVPEAAGPPQWYDLAAVVCHLGVEANTGHYTAQVEYNGVWYDCNDGVVKLCDMPVCSKDAYFCLYRKRDTPAPAGAHV
jgi:hypothetical protein